MYESGVKKFLKFPKFFTPVNLRNFQFTPVTTHAQNIANFHPLLTHFPINSPITSSGRT